MSNTYDQIKLLRQSNIFQFDEEPFSKGAEGIGVIMHDALFFNETFADETSN